MIFLELLIGKTSEKKETKKHPIIGYPADITTVIRWISNGMDYGF